MTITGSTITQNTTIAPGFYTRDGGGIYNSGQMTVADSTISQNSAIGGGGIENFGTLDSDQQHHRRELRFHRNRRRDSYDLGWNSRIRQQHCGGKRGEQWRYPDSQ